MGSRYSPLVGDDYFPERLWVIIPVGGKATRLLPLTAETSKAALRLLNRPLVEFSLLSLARQGIRNFIFGVKGYTNYRDLYDYFGSGYGFSIKYNIKPRIHIKYQPNIKDLGSADSVRINMEYYDIGSPVFAVQGDNIFEIDIKDLIRFHRENGAMMTIVLREVENVEGLGIADIDKNNRIKRFVEKPPPKDAPSNLANTGLYVMSPKIRKIFKDKGVKKIIETINRLDFGYDFIPYLTDSKLPIYGYTLKGKWFDVGTPSNYLKAMNNLLHSGFSMLKDFGGRIDEKRQIWVQGESQDSAKRRQEIIRKVKQGKIEIEGAVVIGRHCLIEDGAKIVNSCIDNFSRIGKGVKIENSAILDRAIIEDNAVISNSIIGRHVTILSNNKKPTKVNSISVIGDNVVIEEGCNISATKIYPHQKVRGNFENQVLMSN
ncbi:MAG TPA: NDP-sugar synthase [Candidatus Glassbacteria bacterium]|nr:NDP-sugar synthase [Candidatus Glassbacteria bacterium]